MFMLFNSGGNKSIYVAADTQKKKILRFAY
jgi:hypothetical protein